MELLPLSLLPLSLHNQYVSPMDHLSLQLEATMIAPVRDEAIAKLTGPDSLKIGLSSSLHSTVRKPKRTLNRVSKIAGPVFVFPLLAQWWIRRQD